MSKKNKEIKDIITGVLSAIREYNEEVEEIGSDLDERLKFTVTVYNANGCKLNVFQTETKEEAELFLQQPQNLGNYITISKEVVCLTTSIPLTEA